MVQVERSGDDFIICPRSTYHANNVVDAGCAENLFGMRRPSVRGQKTITFWALNTR